MAGTSSPSGPPQPRIAYLTGQYPQVSLTFVLREIAALRAMGMDVLSCSIRKTPPHLHPGEAEKAEAARTFYVLEAARNPLTLLRAQAYMLQRPGAYLRTLRLAWRCRTPGWKAALYQIFFFLEALILARHLEAQRVTHLHNHFASGSATVAMLVHELTGIPFSFTLHGPADLFEHWRWRLDEKVARAAFVATISHFARSQLMYFSDPAHWSKIRIVHCGVHPALYAAAPDKEADAQAPLRLLFVGRLAPVKGVRVLLEALEHLPDLSLDIVGDGVDRAGLEAAARPLGARVRFLGYKSQSDVAALLQAADILVLPSFAEGVPVVLMEALASARPVVATQVAGVGELVQDGETGFMVPAGDVAGLVARIRQLADDPDLRAAMGAAGRARVTAEFDITREAARMARLIAEGPGDDLRPVPWTATSA